ncbi:MAG: AAA family ATPase [Bacteroidaceae bacterium]|nr:AAA family ATPase [Bacteroidaceae bacterium]
MRTLTIPIKASFKKEIKIPALEQINLFFGYNGSGKTTISRVLNDEENTCVYNEDFIEENFRNDDKQKGIFTIGKDVGDAKEIIATATSRLKGYQAELDILQGNKEKEIIGKIGENITLKETRWKEISSTLWNIKKNTDNLLLNNCIPGLRNNREKLATDFVSYFNNDRRVVVPKETLSSLWNNLLNRSNVVYNGKSEKKEPLRLPSIKLLSDIVNNDIWGKKIIGNKDNPLYQVIEQLHNSDWVSQGRNFLNKRDICPFCQQPLKQQFLDDLKAYFNESYENDKKSLNELKKGYSYEESLTLIKDFLNEEFAINTQLELKIAEFERLLKMNRDLIDIKISKSSESLELNPLTEKFRDLGREVGTINKKIASYNKQITERKNEQKKLNKDFWDYYTSYYSNDINTYLLQIKLLEQNSVKINKKIDELKESIKNETIIITENQSKLTNIQTSIDSINGSLIRNGFTNFKLIKIGDDSCRIVRIEDGKNVNVYKFLSEGEKTIISFLYFVELCKGTTDKNKDINSDKIIVIDDPISSLSHNIVFEVAQIIRTEFLEQRKLKTYSQLFILTHNLYLYYEVRGSLDNIEGKIAKKNEAGGNKAQVIYNTYKVKINSENSSVVVPTDRAEVLTDYDVYWSIVKDCKKGNGYKAQLPNAMRNILEYYFGFIQGEDNLNNVLNNIDRTFVRFIQRNSHSDKQNFTFNVEEINVEKFLLCFEKIFKDTGQHNHFKIKMK